MAGDSKNRVELLVHDLRGPLGALLSTARLLELATDDPKMKLEAAGIIRRQVQAIDQRLQQFSDLAMDPPDQVHDTSAALPAAASARLSGSATLRVLIVDDDRAAAHLLARLLDKLNCTTCAVGSAEEALQALVEFGPDVVVSDQEMPGLKGDELAREIRSRGRGSRPVLIALSGLIHPPVNDPAVSGFDIVLSKPADLASLEHLLAGLRAAVPADAASLSTASLSTAQ